MNIDEFKEKALECLEKFNELLSLIPKDIQEFLNSDKGYTLLELKDNSSLKQFHIELKSVYFRCAGLNKLRNKKVIEKEREEFVLKQIPRAHEGIDSLSNQIKTTNILEEIRNYATQI